MLADRNRSEVATQDGGAFVTTRWSLVLAAGNSASEAAQPALETLCRTYWLPLYAFGRRLGKSPEDASDLTQGFFARLLEKRWIATADPDRGRFRTFLLTAFRRYISGEDRSAGTEKRGGGTVEFLSIDPTAEARLAVDPADWRTPELAFEEAWAAALLETVLARLREEFGAHERQAVFDALQGFLLGDPPAAGMAAVISQLGMTEGAARMNLTRLRQRYRQILRSEIAQTVASPQEIEDELRHLIQVLTRA
jgi:DNA-directed RNA polymerase specialized sigma24 family protein